MSLPLSMLKAFLQEHDIDFADCFERTELLKRYTDTLKRVDKQCEMRLRAKANKAMSRSSCELAVRLYSDALAVQGLSPELQAQLYANRSAAYFNLKLGESALDDARTSIALDPLYIKGRLRLGSAELMSRRLDEAIETFRTALKLVEEPSPVDAAAQSHAAAAEAADSKAAAQRAVWRDCLQEKLAEAQSQQRARPAPSAAAPEQPGEDGGGEEAAAATGGCALLGKLTEDMLFEVFTHLSHTDVCASASACRAFARVAAGQLVWKSRLARDFPALVEALGEGDEALLHAVARARDWRVLYRERVRREAQWSSGRATCTALDGHRGPVYGISLRGDILASSSEDGTVQIRDLALNRVVHTLRSHGTGILAVWLDPSCRCVVSGGFDSSLKVCRLPPLDLAEAEEGDADPGASGGAHVERNMMGHAGPIVSCLGLGPSQPKECILSTAFDGTLRQWEWNGKAVATWEAHVGHACGLCLDEPSGRVFTGGDDGCVKAWDLRTAECSDDSGHSANGSVWAIAVSGHTLAAGTTDGSLALWDLRVGLSHERVLSHTQAHADAIAGLVFVAGGRRLLSSSFDSTVCLWTCSASPQTATSPISLLTTISSPLLNRCTRVAADDTRIIVGCIGTSMAQLDLL